MLGEIGRRLGRKILTDIATVARPDTILAWYRKLVALKFDGLGRRWPARTGTEATTAGALANLGREVSDQTVVNFLRRHGLPPALERKRTTTWAAFVRTHLALLAGTDFFTADVLTLRGLATYYVLFFTHLERRRGASPESPFIRMSRG